ncbi:transcriptional regulator, partial [Mesorhizobium japonicum]
ARVVELVGELSLASARFRELWARQDVRMLEGGEAHVDHPVVGELHLHRDKLPVEGVLLVVYYADPGSPSAERLQLLASSVADGARMG